jgi:hypothetical protein
MCFEAQRRANHACLHLLLGMIGMLAAVQQQLQQQQQQAQPGGRPGSGIPALAGGQMLWHDMRQKQSRRSLLSMLPSKT